MLTFLELGHMLDATGIQMGPEMAFQLGKIRAPKFLDQEYTKTGVVLSPLENKDLNCIAVTFCTHASCTTCEVRDFKPLIVEGMKTCQIQIVWDLVETSRMVLLFRRNAYFSIAAPTSGVKK